MHRFFYERQNINYPYIKILDKDEIHHLRDVLRLKVEDEVSAVDGQGAEFICRISQLAKDSVRLEIVQEKHHKKENFLPGITLACALPKKSKIDFIVEKLTEIGVDRIILLKTERTQILWRDHSEKIERLRKIAQGGLKQSGSLFLPEIIFLDFNGLLDFKAKNGFDLALLPNLTTDTQNIEDVLKKGQARNILVAIGPEGDFSAKEIELAKEAGFVSVKLTDTVLKVDTAAIVTLAFIKLYCKTIGNPPGYPTA